MHSSISGTIGTERTIENSSIQIPLTTINNIMSSYRNISLLDLIDLSGTRHTYLGHHKSFQTVFVKLYKYARLEEVFTSVSEAFIQARLNHSNICEIYDLELHENSNSALEKYELVMSMEYLPKNLQKEIEEHAESHLRYSERELLCFLASMAQALDYAQSMKICHRDVKPGNILKSQSGYKLCDFGAARIAEGESQAVSNFGTLGYMSPEAVQAYKEQKRRGQYNPYQSDVYSLGLTLLSMAMLKISTYNNPLIREGQEISVINSLPYSQRLKSLLTKMLQRDAANRPSFSLLVKLCEEAGREEMIELNSVVNETLMKVANEVDNARQATENLASALETLWAASLFRKWKCSSFPSMSAPRFYCAKRELLTSFADSADTTILDSINNYEFEYLPLSFFLNTQSSQPTLIIEKYASECAIERIIETTNFGEMILEDGDCRFAVQWRPGCVTVAEEPSTKLQLMTRIETQARILSGQVYRLGSTTLFASHADNDCLTIRCISETSDQSFQLQGALGLQCVLGRSPDSSIVLGSEGVSKAHSVISWYESRWYIKDLQSKNGTWRFCHTVQSQGRRSIEVELVEGQEFRTPTSAYRVFLVAGNNV